MKISKAIIILPSLLSVTMTRQILANTTNEENNMHYETLNIDMLLSLESIRQLSLDYAHLVNARDANGIANLFSPSGYLILPDALGGKIHGTANIERFYEKSLQTYHPWPLFHNHYIKLLDPTHATGTIDVEIRYGNLNYKVALIGIYKDRYEKVGNEWKFSSRELQTLSHFD